MAIAGPTTRDALLQAAELLLEQGGPDAVTTRAVCTAASVQAPTLYHHFGDKAGLLDALVAKGLDAFLMRKQAVADTEDALTDLTTGWEDFVGFAFDRPQLFRLLVRQLGDNPKAVAAVMATTDARLARLANEGRLRTDVAFAHSALLALANGVTSLWAQGISRREIEEVGHFLLKATLEALVHSHR